MPAIDPVFAVALRGATALLLLRAALHKVRDADGFRSALAGYALLPVRLEAMAARVLPALEFTAALLLVGPKTARSGAALAAALLGAYTLAIAVNLVRGRRDLDCGCGGPAGGLRIGGGLLARNALLLAATALCAAPLQPRVPAWLDAFSILGGIAALSALHAASEPLMATAPGRAALRARS
ncbi:MAG: MauE/DoxX family redox-associated membrane protein [Deltaproteobacteria bacterium]